MTVRLGGGGGGKRSAISWSGHCLVITGCPISSFSPLMCKEKGVNFTLRHSFTTQCALLKTFNTSTYVVKDRMPDCAVQRAKCLPMLTWSLPSAVPRWSRTPLQ